MEKRYNCKYCGKEVYRYPSQVKNNVFCSKECGNLFRRTIPSFECEVCHKIFRPKNAKGAHRFCSKECEISAKIYKRCEYCDNLFHAKFIHNNPSKYCSMECYNNFRKSEDEGRVGMFKWKKEVYERCGHICQRCGTTEDLCAHHIFSYANYPELRTNPENGIVYCKKCHKLIHSIYGYHSKEKMIFMGDKKNEK